MSTRSYIAIQNEDKTVTSVYAHWDGYPSHNGRILLESYQDETKIRKLISMGSISSLDVEIDIPGGSDHSFDKKIDGITVFYSRDRDEDLAVDNFDTIGKFNNMVKKSWAEYVYVYNVKKQKWYYRDLYSKHRTKLADLTPKICKMDEVLA